MKIFSSLAVGFFLLTLALISFGQEAAQVETEDNSWMAWQNGVGRTRWLMYHLEKSEVEQLKAKWDTLGQTIENEISEHSGTYILPGYMSGYFLRWSREGGYVFVRFFDVEHPCYFSYGEVKQDGATLNFVQAAEVGSSNCPSNNSGRPASEWVRVMEGDFLIPRAELSDFADYYAGFGNFNGFLRRFEDGIPFAIRSGASLNTASRQLFPSGFEKLEKKPIEGEIVSVGASRKRKMKIFLGSENFESVTPVKINVGRKNGLKVNQEFVLLSDDDGRHETLIITRVGNTTSRGIVVRKLNKDGQEEFFRWDESTRSSIETPAVRLRPGIRITTSPFSKI